MVTLKKVVLGSLLVNEQKRDEAPKAGYDSPRRFAVGQTVELIQGAFSRGPQDWPGSWHMYQ